MRLICPECAAQYEIADALIPPEGRDVECSACGHGWRQPGLATLVLPPEAAVEDDLPPDADDLPLPPSRGLPDPVLAILREEAERELSARAAERTGRSDPFAAGIADATRRPAAGDDPALPDPHALAASLRWEVPERPAAEVILPQLPAPTVSPRLPAPAGALAVALRQQRAHDRGFAWGVLLAALLAGAYVAAPALADRGAAGARLMQAREGADRGRLWLQTRAEALTDGVIERLAVLLD